MPSHWWPRRCVLISGLQILVGIGMVALRMSARPFRVAQPGTAAASCTSPSGASCLHQDYAFFERTPGEWSFEVDHEINVDDGGFPVVFAGLLPPLPAGVS